MQNSTVALNGGSLIFDSSVTSNNNAFTIGGLSGTARFALQNNAGTPAAIALSVGNNNATTNYPGAIRRSWFTNEDRDRHDDSCGVENLQRWNDGDCRHA